MTNSNMQESSPQKSTGKNSTNISDCPELFARWYCLNGATCFSVNIQNSTMYNCWCAKGFQGLRCDYKYASSTGKYQDGQVDGSSRAETMVNETSSGSGQDDQVSFILTVSQHSNRRGDTLGSISRRYTKVINSIVFEALIIFLAITLVVLITRYVRRKLLSNQTVTMAITDASTAPKSNWLKSQLKNEPINHDRNHKNVRVDMIRTDSKSRHHHKQQAQTQSLEPSSLNGRVNHNRHHYCQNDQTITGQISNTAVGMHQVQLMNHFDHQQCF